MPQSISLDRNSTYVDLSKTNLHYTQFAMQKEPWTTTGKILSSFPLFSLALYHDHLSIVWMKAFMMKVHTLLYFVLFKSILFFMFCVFDLNCKKFTLMVQFSFVPGSLQLAAWSQGGAGSSRRGSNSDSLVGTHSDRPLAAVLWQPGGASPGSAQVGVTHAVLQSVCWQYETLTIHFSLAFFLSFFSSSFWWWWWWWWLFPRVLGFGENVWHFILRLRFI